jgi:hypothetical protein
VYGVFRRLPDNALARRQRYVDFRSHRQGWRQVCRLVDTLWFRNGGRLWRQRSSGHRNWLGGRLGGGHRFGLLQRLAEDDFDAAGHRRYRGRRGFGDKQDQQR